MREELAKAKRLSLSGGVLVASVPGTEVPDPRVLSVVIRTVRAELRSADLLGQLASGDIAAMLVRTSAEGVARAAVRVRERLDALARSSQLPPVVVGHALYPAGAGGTPTSLVAKARKDAGLVFS
jgi:GGDEF domain-containing protein